MLKKNKEIRFLILRFKNLMGQIFKNNLKKNIGFLNQETN